MKPQSPVKEAEPEPEPNKYSEDDEYEAIVAELESLDQIPEPPDKAKNAFAITLFCIEAAFDSRSRDFLSYAFDLFPDRDYLIVTQPHTVPESSLLHKFTEVTKKSNNTFSHVLYIIHRDALLDIDMLVRRARLPDIDLVKDQLTADLEDGKDVDEEFYNAIVNPDSKNVAFVARIEDTIVGAFVMSKDVNLQYYKSHFHI